MGGVTYIRVVVGVQVQVMQPIPRPKLSMSDKILGTLQELLLPKFLPSLALSETFFFIHENLVKNIINLENLDIIIVRSN